MTSISSFLHSFLLWCLCTIPISSSYLVDLHPDLTCNFTVQYCSVRARGGLGTSAVGFSGMQQITHWAREVSLQFCLIHRGWMQVADQLLNAQSEGPTSTVSQWAALDWEHGQWHEQHSTYRGGTRFPQSQTSWDQGKAHQGLGARTSTPGLSQVSPAQGTPGPPATEVTAAKRMEQATQPTTYSSFFFLFPF